MVADTPAQAVTVEVHCPRCRAHLGRSFGDRLELAGGAVVLVVSASVACPGCRKIWRWKAGKPAGQRE